MTPEESTAQLRVLTDALLAQGPSGFKNPTKMHRIRASFNHDIETFYEYAMGFTGWDRDEIARAFFDGGMPKSMPSLYQTTFRARELLLIPSELRVPPMEALPWAKLFLSKQDNAYTVPKSVSVSAATYFHSKGVAIEYLAAAYFEPSSRPQHEILASAYHDGIAPEYTTELLEGWGQR